MENVAAIRTRGLGRRYGRTWALRSLDLDIASGELFGLLGPNGAGKTTLFSLLSCRLRPSAGTAHVGGHDVSRAAKRVKKLIGVVPQQAAAYEKLTARENLQIFAELYGLSSRHATQRAEQLLESIGLTSWADAPVGSYSGGMKHRLNLVLGLIHDPSIVFFDEPTTGLDPIARRNLWSVIRALKRAGKTILMTTHYLDEAAELCDRVAILDRGRVALEGAPDRLGDTLEAAYFRCTSGDDAPTGAQRAVPA